MVNRTPNLPHMQSLTDYREDLSKGLPTFYRRLLPHSSLVAQCFIVGRRENHSAVPVISLISFPEHAGKWPHGDECKVDSSQLKFTLPFRKLSCFTECTIMILSQSFQQRTRMRHLGLNVLSTGWATQIVGKAPEKDVNQIWS